MKSDWKIVTINDCADIVGDGLHGTPQYSQNGEYAFVNGNNLINGKVVIKSDTKRVIFSEFEKYKKELNDRTIFVSINGTLGNVSAYNNEKIILGKSVCFINVKNGYDKNFLFYVLSSPTFRNYMETNSTGTTIKNFSLKQMREYSFSLPDICLQKKIAAILSALDEKIATNRAINENLEQQAQAVYYKMFSKVNTEPVELSSIIDVRDGTHDSPKAQATGYYLITSKHLLPFGVDKASANHISKTDFDKINERSLVETQDILMSMIGTIGLISYIPYETVNFAIKNVALFKTSHTPELAYYFLCYLKSEKTLQHIEKCLAGSTQKYISLGELRKMPIYSPTTNEIREFNCLVKPMFEKIVSRTYENSLLVEMRDTLLPKLMSGKLDISAIML